MDKISIDRINKLHPKVRQSALTCLDTIERTCGFNIRVVQGLRTFGEQSALYAQGRTAPGNIVTNAKAGSSYHNYGLALDFCLLHDDKTISWDRNEDMDHDKISDWMEVVSVFKKQGWAWGGDFKSIFDAPHFEKTFGNTTSDCLALHNTGELDKDGYIII